jgi:hypothetical protein
MQGNTVFRSSKPKKQYPYKKWKYPIDELIGKSMFFMKSSDPVSSPDNRVTWRGDSKAP